MPFRIADLEPAKWILNGVLPLQPRRAPDWSGNIVANCLPDVFPSYAKVLHAIWEDTSVNDRTTSWQDVRGDDALDKIASFAVEPEAVRDLFKDSVTVRGRTADEGKLRRFRWSSLAERYGIIFNPSINDNSVTSRFPGRSWPRYLVGPDEGTLDEESVLCLCDLFWHFTGNQECYFMYDLIATSTYADNLLFRAGLGQLPAVMDEASDSTHGWNTPTYWWPEDRSWCLCSDWDLTFTLVGGSEQLVSEIGKRAELECVEVASDTRIDYKADQSNLGSDY